MAVYYIYGTSNSGSTFGTKGFFYPLYLTQLEALEADTNSPETSHAHTFEEVTGVTFYMPDASAMHAQASAPTGQFGGESYISYTSPISDADIEPINFGVLAGDTFNSWRRKTNEVARDAILNKATIASLDTRFTRLIDVTGGENNIMTLTSSDNITGEKEFEGIVKFTAADDSTNAIQVGANGKIYVEGSEFKFTKSIDLHTASGTLKASFLDVPTGRTKYANTTYTWPTDAPIPGQVLKVKSDDVLEWDFEEAVQLNVDPFLIEDPNPIGSMIQWTKAAAPSKWKLCNGQALNTYTYRALHEVISNIYGGTAFLEGTTDQSGATTTFNLPNMGGRIPIGRGTGIDANNLNSDTLPSGGFNVLGASGGEYKHTLTVDELAEHTHETDANNSNGIDGDGYFQGLGYKPRRSNPNNSKYAEIIAKPTGGDLPHNNIQPYIVLNYIIKTESSSVVVQNVTPTKGIHINGSHSQTNLLGSSTDPDALGGANNANSITLNVDLNDFEFVNHQLKIVDTNLSPNIVQAVNQAATRSSDAPVVGTFIDYPSLEVTITPAFDGSKFLISGDAHMGAYQIGHDYVSKYTYKKNEGGVDNSSASFLNFLLPTSPGSRVAGHGVHFCYSDRQDDIGNVKPATLLMTPVSYSVSAGDSFTFKIQVASLYTHTSARYYFNNSESQGDSTSFCRTVSQITVQEIRQSS